MPFVGILYRFCRQSGSKFHLQIGFMYFINQDKRLFVLPVARKLFQLFRKRCWSHETEPSVQRRFSGTSVNLAHQVIRILFAKLFTQTLLDIFSNIIDDNPPRHQHHDTIKPLQCILSGLCRFTTTRRSAQPGYFTFRQCV